LNDRDSHGDDTLDETFAAARLLLAMMPSTPQKWMPHRMCARD
jgi:hypothetical protein